VSAEENTISGRVTRQIQTKERVMIGTLKSLAVLATLGATVMFASPAKADRWSVGFGISGGGYHPGYYGGYRYYAPVYRPYYQSYYYSAPVYYPPVYSAPVYSTPYYAPAPVVYSPPVYYTPAPVYYSSPSFSLSFGGIFGGGHYHGGGWRGHR
jgi:hypothetical protein